MGRPLFYFTTVLFQALFWLVELLSNYSDYIEGSPIFLKKPFVEMFEMNRIPLLVTELLVPLVMTIVFTVLTIIKLRSRGIRYAYLLILFIATEFWMVRAFVFPDRMLNYYQMSDPEYYQGAGQSDPFLYYFIAHAVLFAMVILVREYSRIPEDELLAPREISSRE